MCLRPYLQKTEWQRQARRGQRRLQCLCLALLRHGELREREVLSTRKRTSARQGRLQARATPTISESRVSTLMFTDIVGSTQMAVEKGNLRFADLLEVHHAAVRSELALHRGKEVNTAGDGFLASFDGPARAIKCAIVKSLVRSE
jgi:class 3 adenylate cyclase